MKHKLQIVDAFTEQRFAGNPAAVVISDDWLADTLMQSVARENNLSETAFLVQTGNGRYDIRWFSPLKEIAFCGHASLAAAFVIFQAHRRLDTIVLSATAIGDFTVTRASDGRIQMAFPKTLPQAVDEVPEALYAGLSIPPVAVLRNAQAYFAIYDQEQDVYGVTPAVDMLKTLAPYDVVVTARGSDYDFVSRYFWPANGGEEDPVTGSIHTGLAPYWGQRLGKTQLRAYQASQRGGVVYCAIAGEQVIISGYGVSYLEGSIEL